MEDAFISRSSRIKEDPLSDVLSLLKPRGYQSGGIDAGGDWSFRHPKSNGFFCLAFVSGHCWLFVDGIGEPVLLQAGEFAVLPHGPAFRMASHPAVPPVDVLSLRDEKLNGKILTWQGGGLASGSVRSSPSPVSTQTSCLRHCRLSFISATLRIAPRCSGTWNA